MANNIEWAHTTSGAQTMTPMGLYAAEPDHRMLDPELGPWGAAILTGDASVAIYADTPLDLLEWLEKRTSEVRALIHAELRRRPAPEFTVEHLVRNDDGEPVRLTVLHTTGDRAQALWHYLAAADEVPLTDELRLVEHHPGDTEVQILAQQGPDAS